MSFHIVRAVAKKTVKDAVGRFRKKPQRFDEHLPLGIQLERVVDVSQATLAAFHGLVALEFPSFPVAIEAIGKIDLGEGTLAYRCYLEGTDAFLQIVAEREAVAECRLYVLDRDIYPPTTEDWDLWLNAEHGIIGCPEVLHGDGEELVYAREWLPGAAQAAPVEFNERILLDATGEDITEEEQQAMSYFRVAYGNANDPDDPERIDEYLLISAGEGVVELYLGVDILPGELTII